MAKAKATDLMAEVNRTYPGAVMLGSDPDLQVLRWPTGVVPVDDLMDGGVPRGRWIEVYGPYSTLKSYYLYKALGAVQRQGGRAGLVDTEHSYDPEWAEFLGVDVARLLVSHPDTAEDAVGVLEYFVRDGFDLFGFDSIASAVPAEHRNNQPGLDNQPGALARVMSKGLARLTSANKHTAGIFINQTRQKIGLVFGSPETTSGGLAMQFYASYRLHFRRTGKVTEKVKRWDGTENVDTTRVVAHKISATLEKSKLSAPNEEARFIYDLRTGTIDTQDYLIARGIERGLIVKSGSGHYRIPDVMDQPLHGRGNFTEWVSENPEVLAWLESELLPPVASPGSRLPRNNGGDARK